MRIWVKMPNGKVKNNQLSLDILILSLRNIFDNNGENKYIPKKDIPRSNRVYSPMRNCLRKSIVFIFI